MKFKNAYQWILANKLITICILFTVFTMLDTIPILFGLWPAKEGINTYIHLVSRLVLQSILVLGLYLFDLIKKKIKSGFLVYIIVFLITWGILVLYVVLYGLIEELHPDAIYYASRSYAFMYFLLGIVIFSASGIKKIIKKKQK